MNNDSRGLLIQAEQARERGDFKKSLELLSTAIVVIMEERKEEKLVDALSSQALVYRHLFDSTGSEKFLIMAKHASSAAVEIADLYKDPTLVAVSYYNLGKVQERLGEINEAIKNIKKAVNQNVERSAFQAEMKSRLSVLEYKNGDKSSMERFEKAVEELKNAEDRDNYAKSVWLSGAYMHMAEILIDTDKKLANELLDEAKKIIASDMRLKLRKNQLDKLLNKTNG